MDHNRGLGSLMFTTECERQAMEIESKDEHGREMLTVGQLRQILDGLRDEILVVLDDGESWWHHVSFVGVPNADPADDSGYNALSFARGSALDTRDF